MAPRILSPWEQGARFGSRHCGAFRAHQSAPAQRSSGDSGPVPIPDPREPQLEELGPKVRSGVSEASTACGSEASAGARSSRQCLVGCLAGHFDLGVTLGSGRFGSVRAATSKVDGRKCAIKSLALHNRKDTSAVDAEVQCMRSLSHVNIVELYDFLHLDGPGGTRCHLVMELCDGTIMDVLRDHCNSQRKLHRRFEGGLPPQLAELFLGQMVSALAHVHSRGFVHRDIKLQNFLVVGELVKLGDFGLAVPLSRSQPLSRKCGTRAYMAPEVSEKAYGRKADVWSLGTAAFIMCTDHFPFCGEPGGEEYVRLARLGAVDPCDVAWAPHRPEIHSVVVGMLTADAVRRPTCKELQAQLAGCRCASPA